MRDSLLNRLEFKGYLFYIIMPLNEKQKFCLLSPVVSRTVKCKASLDQDSFDEKNSHLKKSKRSASNEWSKSSSFGEFRKF
jgi:hypothetical protein